MRLKVYNAIGQRVAVLVDDRQAAGRYEVRWGAGTVASGIYFYVLPAGTYHSVRRAVVIK